MPLTPPRRLLVPLLLFVALVHEPASGAGAVSVSATRDGAIVTVTGSASLPAGPLVQVAQDGTGDTAIPLGGVVAGDLTGVALATDADGDLLVRWTLASLPPTPHGTAAVYRHRFRSGGTDYEVAAARSDGTGFDGCTANNVPCRAGWLLRCTTTCSWSPSAAGGPVMLSRDLVVSLDSAGAWIQVSVPAGSLAGVIGPGGSIGPPVGPGADASTGLGQLELSNDVDGAEATTAYVYGLVVMLGAADPAADPAAVSYVVPATADPDNVRFAGSLEVPAGQAVFVRACLGGPANCAYGRSEAL